MGCCKQNNLHQMPQMVTIKKVITETAQVKTFVFDCSLGAKPGQFLNIWIPRMDEKPFSIAYDDGQELWVTFFAVGPFSTELQKRQPGDQVGIRGPYGTHYEYDDGDHLALVAGGYGAAPMYFVAKEAIKRGCTVEYIVGARSKDHLLFLDKADALGDKVTVHVATDDGSYGFHGYNVALLQKLHAEGLQPDKVFACGPERMLKALSDWCAGENISAQLSLERYMKCSFGVCGHCAMDPLGLLACKDGPVFDNSICQQLTEFGSYHRDKNGKRIDF